MFNIDSEIIQRGRSTKIEREDSPQPTHTWLESERQIHCTWQYQMEMHQDRDHAIHFFAESAARGSGIDHAQAGVQSAGSNSSDAVETKTIAAPRASKVSCINMFGLESSHAILLDILLFYTTVMATRCYLFWFVVTYCDLFWSCAFSFSMMCEENVLLLCHTVHRYLLWCLDHTRGWRSRTVLQESVANNIP